MTRMKTSVRMMMAAPADAAGEPAMESMKSGAVLDLEEQVRCLFLFLMNCSAGWAQLETSFGCAALGGHEERGGAGPGVGGSTRLPFDPVTC